MFSTGIKNKFNNRVYVDLFSGSGCSGLEDDDKIYKGSPLLSLSVPDKFTKYIFCESDKNFFDLLTKRIDNYSECNKVLFNADCHQVIDKIILEIPVNSSLSCCFIDPWSINIDFATIKKLANSRRVDFLILLALGMDVKRNKKIYLDEQNNRIDKLLGSSSWRENWNEKESVGEKFARFVAETFSEQMFGLGYLKDAKQTRIFKLNQKNVPLYYIAFYSKDQLGYKYWHEVLKYETEQEELNLFG